MREAIENEAVGRQCKRDLCLLSRWAILPSRETASDFGVHMGPREALHWTLDVERASDQDGGDQGMKQYFSS